MDNNMEIDMNLDVHKFCVSAVSCLVAEFRLNKVVQTWNSHLYLVYTFLTKKKMLFH